MEVILAKSAGFCFGVERAVKAVYEESEKEEQGVIFTAGPIIHNEEVISDLEMRGVRILNEETDHPDASSTVIIRSHGITKEAEDRLRQSGAKILDETCPFVKKIHRIVEEQSKQGRKIVIVGNPEHPEVRGILGWCPEGACVIQSSEDAEAVDLPDNSRVCVVSQTTFRRKKFQELVEILSRKQYDINVLNTICNATQERQEEARQIAGRVDGMIVIGGRNSSNSQKLFEICSNECGKTVFIQTVRDLSKDWFDGMKTVGITAGASTPKKIIEEVQTYVGL